MPRPVRWPRILLMMLACFSPTIADADLDPRTQRGERVVQIPVPGREAEICVIPKHLSNAKYSDRDLQAEGKLCAIDEHSNAAVCPKVNSTNPGLDFFSVPPTSSSRQAEAAQCKAGSQKIA